MYRFRSLVILIFLMFLYSCSNGTVYQQSSDNSASISFSVQDQKKLVQELAEELLSNEQFKQIIGDGRPTLLIDKIKNKTSEHIDTESITDSLKTNIVRGRLFSVVSRDSTNLLAKEASLSQSGLTDSQRATKLGRLWGAKYVMYGNFSSIVNYVGKEKQVYYKFTLILQNIETGEEVWIDEADVNKVYKKGLF